MKSNFNINYERDAISTYMVIKADTSIEIENYEVEMIKRNQLDSFLDLNVRMYNSEKSVYYNITSKQQLTEILQRKRLVYGDIIQFFTELITLIESCTKYYLTSLKIILDPNLIYVSPDKFSPCFVYIPFNNMSIDIIHELRQLIDYLFDKVDQNDVKAVMLIHKIITSSKQEDFSLNIIKDVISNNKSVNVVDKKEVEEVVRDNEKNNSKNNNGDNIIPQLMKQNERINRSKIENEIKREHVNQIDNNNSSHFAKKYIASHNKAKKIKERKSDNKNLFYYILIGCIQILVILLFLLLLKSRVLCSDITGKIKLESLFASIVVLLSLDLYASKKLVEYMTVFKKNESVNMNKQKIYNQPAIDTFSISTRNREKLFGESPWNNNIKNNEENGADNCIKQGLLEGESVKQEINHVSDHSSDLTYASEDTQLLMDYNKRLGAEIEPYLLSKDNDILNKIILSNNPFIIGKLDGQVDYIIKNSSVSRIHCKIVKEEDAYFIIDLNSKNGTYLDGERLVSNEKYRLNDGSDIAISNCDYTFEME